MSLPVSNSALSPRKSPDSRAPGPLLLTPSEVAATLRVHPQTVYAWLKAGRLRVLNLGTEKHPTLRVRLSDVQMFLAEREVRGRGLPRA